MTPFCQHCVPRTGNVHIVICRILVYARCHAVQVLYVNPSGTLTHGTNCCFQSSWLTRLGMKSLKLNSTRMPAKRCFNWMVASSNTLRFFASAWLSLHSKHNMPSSPAPVSRLHPEAAGSPCHLVDCCNCLFPWKEYHYSICQIIAYSMAKKGVQVRAGQAVAGC